MSKITYFKSLTSTKQPYYYDSFQAFERIRTGKSRETVEKVRAARNKGEEEEQRKLKNMLPCICFSGTFETRKDSDLINHSGLVCLDFDKVGDPEVIKEKLKNDEYVHAAFISPSGDGIKVVVKIPDNELMHKKYFMGLMHHFEIDGFDTSSKNVSRICFESYDPDIYVNITSKIFTSAHEEEQKEYTTTEAADVPITNSQEILEKLYRWMEKTVGPYQHNIKGDGHPAGGRHNWIVRFAASCNTYGVPYSDCYSYVQALGDIGQEEITKSLGWAYSKTSEFNTKYFVNRQAKEKARNMVRHDHKKDEIKKYLSDIEGLKPSHAERIVNDIHAEMNNRDESFWRADTNQKGQTKITFQRHKFIDWVQAPPQSVGRYKMTPERWELVRAIEGKRVKIIQQDDFVRIPFNYIENLPEHVDRVHKSEIWEQMAKGVNQYFSKSLQQIMPPFPYQFQRDTQEHAYFYFQNTAIRVSAKGLEQMSYDQIDNHIWESHVISEHELKLSDKTDNDYSRFMELVCKEDNQRFDRMRSVAGYLMHNYKHRLKSKMVILYDEIISDNPEGGTGKGVLIQGIEQLRNMVQLDGKSIDFSSQFLWQRVNPDTSLVVLQDLDKKFNMEKMFSLITDGMAVNKKFAGEIYLPFEYSPKFIATSNYVLKGRGNSHDRRKIELELAQYFNRKHTPLQEFGRVLFDDWNYNDWNAFFNFMIQCTQLYFSKGIVEADVVNLGVRRFISNTSEEFVEWCIAIQTGYKYERSALFRRFQEDYRGDVQWVKLIRFNRWLKILCEEFNMGLDESRSGNEFYVEIVDNRGEFQAFKDRWARKKSEDFSDFDGEVPF